MTLYRLEFKDGTFFYNNFSGLVMTRLGDAIPRPDMEVVRHWQHRTQFFGSSFFFTEYGFNRCRKLIGRCMKTYAGLKLIKCEIDDDKCLVLDLIQAVAPKNEILIDKVVISKGEKEV